MYSWQKAHGSESHSLSIKSYSKLGLLVIKLLSFSGARKPLERQLLGLVMRTFDTLIPDLSLRQNSLNSGSNQQLLLNGAGSKRRETQSRIHYF